LRRHCATQRAARNKIKMSPSPIRADIGSMPAIIAQFVIKIGARSGWTAPPRAR
jgi:hypothetical protein